MRGSISGKYGCQYPEWVTDRPDIFGLANSEFMEMKTCRWQVPFPKWMHHSTKLKVTSDSSKWFMQYKAMDGLFLPWETFTKIFSLEEFQGFPIRARSLNPGLGYFESRNNLDFQKLNSCLHLTGFSVELLYAN